jgi:NAD(P)-dependent dehydrogenase (short-subunit alcohol dehydrogenase family)
MDFNGKTVLVTGGTTGIGFATVKRFAEQGARVYTTGQNPETIATARGQLNGTVDVVQSNAADEDNIKALMEQIKGDTGKIDVLVLNAGIAKFAPIEMQSVEGYDDMFNVNVRGPWLTVKHSLSLMGEGSNIVWVTSVVNTQGMAGASAYGGTKAAARNMVRSLAAELAPKKIRVNAVSPGPVETPIFGKTGMPAEQMNEMAEFMMNSIPLGRLGQPNEIATAITYIAGSGASFIHGAELAVDGGMAQV